MIIVKEILQNATDTSFFIYHRYDNEEQVYIRKNSRCLAALLPTWLPGHGQLGSLLWEPDQPGETNDLTSQVPQDKGSADKPGAEITCILRASFQSTSYPTRGSSQPEDSKGTSE